MIPVQEASRIILEQSMDFGRELVSLHKANGRVLKEVLFADRNFPPFDRVTMDGIAINASAFLAGNRTFRIQGLQAAGQAQQRLNDSAHCIEIMTGAVCPAGADTVIRYEDVNISESEGKKIAKIQLDEIRPQQNIHHKGSDRPKGEILCP